MTRVAFIVNGDYDSAMGHRARAFAQRLAAHYDIRLAYRAARKLTAIFRFFAFLVGARPRLTYVFDMAYSGVLGAALYRTLSGTQLVIETGDAIYELAKSSGMRGPLGLWLTRWLENFSLRIADRIVVRGSFHQRWLAEQGIESDVIQDGIDTGKFKPEDVVALRRQLRLDGVLTVGLVGSSVWSEKLQWCYGWELVETIRLLKDRPVEGLMIGDGSGIARLKSLCREYGIEDRVRFWGYVPYAELTQKLNLMDVCLSTQTNDLVGQVRTTGKLPLYLATGRYVLASEVGEAAILLDRAMLVPYDGVADRDYPRKLAERLSALIEQPELLTRAAGNTALARRHFDYDVLAERLRGLIETTLEPIKGKVERWPSIHPR